MAITAAVGRIGTTFLAMVGTRLELAAVEVQEETRRLLGYLAWTLLAVVLAAAALLLVALFVILLFWDSYRLHAVGAMAALFALGGMLIVMKVRASFDSRPPFLSATLDELRNDLEFVKSVGHPHEQ
jgi:uncharacterized membrane protein YqjE